MLKNYVKKMYNVVYNYNQGISCIKEKSDMNCNPIKVIDSFKQYVQTLIDEEKSDTKYGSAKVIKKLENIIKEVNKVKEEYKEISLEMETYYLLVNEASKLCPDRDD